ncbi:MAG: helix-turn-helix transcriptional regulator [bacterium]
MPDAQPVSKGTLDIIVLRALSWSPMHGVEIIAWLEEYTKGRLELDDSGVYQALYRMEGRALVSAAWGVTDNKRRARYYSVTAAGTAYLRAETRKWVRYTDTVTELLTRPLPAGGSR